MSCWAHSFGSTAIPVAAAIRTIPSDRVVSASVEEHIPGVHAGNGHMPAQKRFFDERWSCQLHFEEWRVFYVCPFNPNW